jgi:hypothetical protein
VRYQPHERHDRFRLRFTQRQRNSEEPTISQERTQALTRAQAKHASFRFPFTVPAQRSVLLAHRGSRVRLRTPNEAIKSTVDNNIRSFGWKLAPFHSPPATPQTFAVRMETEIPSAQP